MKETVVITGLGVVSPIGIGVDAFWEGLLTGRSGVARLTRFDASPLRTQIGAEVKHFDPLQFMDKKAARESDVFIQYALAAAAEALHDAEHPHKRAVPERLGVVIGTSIGGLESLMAGQRTLETRGPDRVSPKWMTKWIPNMAAYQIAAHFGARGTNLTVSTACASSNNAFGTAMQAIRRGEADVIIAGGAESLFSPVVMAGLGNAGALSERNDAPHKASRPFDLARDGMVIGEGAGIVILESRTHAEKRGARIYCELAGYAANGEGVHPTAPSPDGQGERLAMSMALKDAGMQPEEIDYINAHGTSTPLGDEVETLAIKLVFGQHAGRLKVSSIKGATGHLLGAAGAVELVATVKAISEGIIPPTMNYETPDPNCDLDYVPNQPLQMAIGGAVSNSFGFGGQNASVVLRRWREM